MINYFKPLRLQHEVQVLEEKFKAESDDGRLEDTLAKADLEKLIHKIVSCPAEELRGFAFSLTKRELLCVAGYLRSNYLHVPLKQVFLVLEYADNAEIFKKLFAVWQERYTQPFQHDEIDRCVDHYAPHIFKSSVSSEELKHWMTDRDADQDVARFININMKADGKEDFERKMHEISISSKSLLGINVRLNFYASCKRTDYLLLGDMELSGLLHKTEIQNARSIIVNFLEKMQEEDYEKFYHVADAAKSFFGEPYSAKCHGLMKAFSPEIEGAYNAFINQFWLIKLFGNDRRSRFWKKYISKFKAEFNSRHNLLIMDFGNMYATEFMEVGVIYFFPKDYFDKRVRMELYSSSTQELKHDMRHFFNHIFMKEHRGNWEYDVRVALTKNKMI